MAKYPVYSIRDKVRNKFDTNLMLQDNDQSALRSFSYIVNNPNGIQNFSPTDFDLFKIGSYDCDSGQFESMLPEFIVNGGSVLVEK